LVPAQTVAPGVIVALDVNALPAVIATDDVAEQLTFVAVTV